MNKLFLLHNDVRGASKIVSWPNAGDIMPHPKAEVPVVCHVYLKTQPFFWVDAPHDSCIMALVCFINYGDVENKLFSSCGQLKQRPTNQPVSKKSEFSSLLCIHPSNWVTKANYKHMEFSPR